MSIDQVSNGSNKISYKQQVHLLGAGVLVFLLLFVSCSKEKKPQNKPAEKALPSQVVKNAHLIRSLGGNVDIEMKAPLIEIYSQDTSLMCCPEGIDITFINPDMTKKAHLKADYAINRNNSNLYYIKDNVEIIDFENQDTFYCTDLYWIKDSALLRTDLPIRRVSAAGTDFGDGLRATDTFDSVQIKNPHGTQLVDENQ